MDEPKDHGIKLFGRTIPLPEVSPSAAAAATVDYRINQDPICSSDSSPESDRGRDGKERDSEKETSKENPADTKQEDEAQSVTSEESSNPDSTTGMSEKLKAPSFEKEISTEKNSKLEEERSEASTSQEKTLKKPDKILPCPRCKSMDTKFCYYNNYNVSQPRHFCKNCQRYWTAGGTMRNVPVGAGRRKSKNSASHYRQITVSESLHNVLADYPNGGHRPTVKTNGNVLTFGSDAPLCESMASVLNIADKAMRNCSRNGFDKAEELRIELTCRGGETRENHSNGVAVSNSKDETGSTTSQENVMQCYQGFPPHMPWFPGAPWPYPWNSARWSSPVTPSEIFPPGFPIPFYHPAAYWSCTVPGAWSIPWIPQPTSPGTPSSGPSSPSLGKHSRDENIVKASNSREQEQQKDNNAEGCLWIPKTLRIDDPGEAAKSSIWTTLGIKKEKANSIGGGLFKAFQPNRGEKNQLTGASRVLQANPAALSRSLNFQESS